jgi:hypothetical protein
MRLMALLVGSYTAGRVARIRTRTWLDDYLDRKRPHVR